MIHLISSSALHLVLDSAENFEPVFVIAAVVGVDLNQKSCNFFYFEPVFVRADRNRRRCSPFPSESSFLFARAYWSLSLALVCAVLVVAESFADDYARTFAEPLAGVVIGDDDGHIAVSTRARHHKWQEALVEVAIFIYGRQRVVLIERIPVDAFERRASSLAAQRRSY